MKPFSLKTQRILMWIPYLNLLNWFSWSFQNNLPKTGSWSRGKVSLTASGLMFLIFLPTSILVQLFPDAVMVGWVGFYLGGWVPGRYLIRVQEKLGQ